MAITLAKAIEFRDLFEEAYKAVISGQKYSINTGGTSRSLERADAEWLKKEWLSWCSTVDDIESGSSAGGGGIRTKLITPLK